jgi:protein-L-isoaspartate O-methyltransferase
MQLCDGGFFVGPVEREDGSQQVVRLTRRGTSFTVERLIDCSFVPLVREVSSLRESEPMVQGKPHGR